MAVLHVGCPSDLVQTDRREEVGWERSGIPCCRRIPARLRPVDRVHGPRHHPIPAFPECVAEKVCGRMDTRERTSASPYQHPNRRTSTTPIGSGEPCITIVSPSGMKLAEEAMT